VTDLIVCAYQVFGGSKGRRLIPSEDGGGILGTEGEELVRLRLFFSFLFFFFFLVCLFLLVGLLFFVLYRERREMNLMELAEMEGEINHRILMGGRDGNGELGKGWMDEFVPISSFSFPTVAPACCRPRIHKVGIGTKTMRKRKGRKKEGKKIYFFF